ncbi:MAG TPA: hypothetical protein DCM38_03470 [Gammaproteobacteria bacterium]|nr:hypothetical protein [Gammaproteobacteria bacterium]
MIEEQQNAELKQQIYLQRVNQLHTHIINWLQDEPFILEKGNMTVQSALGDYQAARLSIQTERGETLANLFSKGTSVLLGEGLIEMEGVVGTESIIYMLKGGLIITDRYGKNRPMYKGIHENGWYWIEDSYRNKAHLMNKTLFLELITLVSDYEFDSII